MMVSFDERLGYFLLGCFIGFVLGYIVRSLREIKEGVDEVEGTLKNENGFVRNPILLDITMLLVVAITVWAAFHSQRAVNQMDDGQRRLEIISNCHQSHLERTVSALNERSKFVEDRGHANVELQKYQARFLSVILQKPPAGQTVRDQSLQNYYDALNTFIESNAKTRSKRDEYPYPTREELENCLD